jgi:pimeloyl-ACP methyl ester carboxylesterase
VITPQFVSAKDIAAHGLSDKTLRWREDDWQRGYPSNDIAAVSSFQVVDEIFKRLANRRLFPNLKTIVLAGHSAGGQFVQRYAAVGRGEADLGSAAIHVRYVVANPSSYLYFTDDRPTPDGGFAPFNDAACPRFNRWSDGFQSGVPAYALPLPAAEAVQARYLRRDVVYLLGTADNDPQADGLDKSCGGEAEGPSRLARGLAYDAYIHRLDPQTKQHVLKILGVRHLSYAMFSSICGRAALFDEAGCDSVRNNGS